MVPLLGQQPRSPHFFSVRATVSFSRSYRFVFFLTVKIIYFCGCLRSDSEKRSSRKTEDDRAAGRTHLGVPVIKPTLPQPIHSFLPFSVLFCFALFSCEHVGTHVCRCQRTAKGSYLRHWRPSFGDRFPWSKIWQVGEVRWPASLHSHHHALVLGIKLKFLYLEGECWLASPQSQASS